MINLFCPFKYHAEINKVISSAKGTASHTPVIPMIIGRSTILATIKTKVLQKEIMAEIFPFESAVNSAEAKILIPANR